MEDFEALATRYVKGTYVRQGLQSLRTRQKLINQLLSSKKIPVDGWDDMTIEFAIQELSAMDSNNFPANCGVGEREGRVYSTLVQKRHFGLAHGIGRSGDIAETQPKAAGSSLIYKLTTCMTTHALNLAGLKTSSAGCLLMPLATGMTLSVCMQALRVSNPTAKYVVWPRIDQKSCFKSILTAGLTPLIVDCKLENGELRSDIDAIRQHLQTHGKDVLCILSTTSCFAPRQPDQVDEIAKLCQEYGIGHVINNAYGLQCNYICKLINRAAVVGRVDMSKY
jgi:O-phospho-L-seryl-tRNASec:L-selenocysteinyl-tRNA synthase